MSLRQRIEAGFTAWGRFTVRRRWWVILACVALSGVLMSRLGEIRVDNSNEAFLHADDPERLRYDRFRDEFDREDRVLVVLRADDVFARDFVEWLRGFHRDMETEVPFVEEVTSLINARNTRGEGDELIVEELMEAWPETEAALETIRARALANPLYIDAMLTSDATHAVLSLKPFTYSTLGLEGDVLAGFEDGGNEGDVGAPAYLSDAEGNELVDAVYAVIDRHRTPEVEIHVIGGPTFDHRLNRMLQRDVTVFMTGSLLLEVILLFVLFPRLSGMTLPVTVVVLSMLSTMGFMAWLDIPFSITLNILPAFLLVVGLCDAVHILAIAYRRMAQGDTKPDAIVYALTHSGLAVVMTSVTTAAGLASFSLAALAPIAQLGILAPAGVVLAMVYSLALLPALLAVSPLARRASPGGVAGRGVADRFLARMGEIATRHPLRVVAATGVILAAALPGLLQVYFAQDGMRWFPEDDPLRVAEQVFDRQFKGASSLEVLVHTSAENGLYDPDTLRRIERAMRHSESLMVDHRPVGKVVSIVDVVKEIHLALNEDRPGFHVLPEKRDLIAQELLLFENSGTDDLEEVTDSLFQTARVSLRTPWADALVYPAFIEKIRGSWTEILGDDIRFELTGGTMLFTRVFEALIYSLARSYAFALAVITPLMIVLIGSLRRGVVAMVPNLIPVYLCLALMGYVDLPLDVGTLLIGGVIIGLAVDDTIHFMHRFGRYYEESLDAHYAVHETLATTGTALLFTSLVLAAGFSVFLLSYMQNTLWFGVLCLFGTTVAFLADILLAPALMVLVTRWEKRQAATL
jgi:predicted RND superfamily exporter protein